MFSVRGYNLFIEFNYVYPVDKFITDLRDDVRLNKVPNSMVTRSPARISSNRPISIIDYGVKSIYQNQNDTRRVYCTFIIFFYIILVQILSNFFRIWNTRYAKFCIFSSVKFFIHSKIVIIIKQRHRKHAIT